MSDSTDEYKKGVPNWATILVTVATTIMTLIMTVILFQFQNVSEKVDTMAKDMSTVKETVSGLAKDVEHERQMTNDQEIDLRAISKTVHDHLQDPSIHHPKLSEFEARISALERHHNNDRR